MTHAHRYPTSINCPIWLSGLDCPTSNTTANLRNCSQSPIGQNMCTHLEDVILSCLTGIIIYVAMMCEPPNRGHTQLSLV